MKRTFPRTKLRGAIKKNKPYYRCGKNIDLLIFLDYVLMLKALAREASHEALENRERTITAAHIQKVEKAVGAQNGVTVCKLCEIKYQLGSIESILEVLKSFKG